jgi:hypothetical protein
LPEAIEVTYSRIGISTCQPGVVLEELRSNRREPEYIIQEFGAIQVREKSKVESKVHIYCHEKLTRLLFKKKLCRLEKKID